MIKSLSIRNIFTGLEKELKKVQYTFTTRDRILLKACASFTLR